MIHSQLYFNKCFDKNKLKGLISWSLRNYGEATTLDLVEKLKNVGFFWATQAGISLSIDDLKIPKEKSSLLLDAEKISSVASEQFLSGNLTTVERLQQMIDAWHRTSENLKQEVVANFRRTDPLNPVYMMAFSGARGNISQVRQLVGMRGLMADPQGRIIDFPIRSNFREGLTLTEYVISCYGARKGIVDTALRTATSGYLTRRLVDVAQHIVVSNYDCGTEHGIPLSPLKQGTKILLPLTDRILGRVLAEDLIGLANRNTCISQYLALKISKIRESVYVRSPLMCKAKNGVCQLCYGWSLAHNELVSIGEAVGIIAAQSIGEPGTQLTMRTFHTGGVFSGEIIDQIQSNHSGRVSFTKTLKGSLVRTSYGKIGFLTREAGTLLIFSLEKHEKVEEIAFPSQSILFVRQGQKVEQNEILLEYASSATDQDQGIQATHLVTAPQKGEVFFEDVVVFKDDLNPEAQACQLGSFWLLTSHLYSNSEKVPGSFKYFKGDLICEQGGLQSTKILSSNLNFPYLKNVADQGGSTTSIPSVQSKIFDFSFKDFKYQNGLYLTFFNSQFGIKNFLSVEKQNFLEYLDQTVFSFTSFSFLNQFKNVEGKKAHLFFFFSLSKFWFLSQKQTRLSTPYLFRKKIFEFIQAVPEKDFSQPKNFRNVRKLHNGAYSFKKEQANLKKPTSLKQKFYTGKTVNVQFSENSKKWNFSKTAFSFSFNLARNVFSKVFDSSFCLKTPGLKPVIPQMPEYFIQYCFSRNRRTFVSFLEFLVKQKQVKDIKILEKIVCLPQLFLGVKSYFGFTSLLNKQTVDNSLLLRSAFNFDFEIYNKYQDSNVAICQIQTPFLFDDLSWIVDQSNFGNLGIYGTTKTVLPKEKQTLNRLTKSEVSNFLTWKSAKRKIVQDNFILGQIENKTKKPLEVFKRSENSEFGKFLALKNSDFYVIRVNNFEKSQISSLLGSLIRPGKELLNNFTIRSSGQILVINKDFILIRKALPILFSSKANFHVFHGDFIEKGLPLITLTYKRLTTGDIVQGIPRIEQLFEARQTTTVLHEQLHELFETYKTRMRLDLAARKSFQKIQRILIDSIQRVYESQGVTISDKHLEIIVRQMTSTVRILEGGRTRLLRGELKPIDWIEKINLGIDIQKAEYEPILLGITKASLETESFISAASFQETTRTLSRAAIEGRTDFLRGLKENVILGHRVPAGTGAPLISYLTKFSTDVENVEDFSSELTFLLKE
jgi:hypothetical protein